LKATPALWVAGLLFALASAGCSFLIGVSEDPVVDAFPADASAADEDASPR